VLQPPNQILDPHVQGVRQDFERLEGDVALPALDPANVRAVQAGAVGEHVLGPSVLRSARTFDLLLDGLHQQQCGASPVITSTPAAESRTNSVDAE
jgi:hypothetical protein